MIDQILATGTEYFASFNTYARDNQMIAGAVSLWGLGVITYFCRTIPSRIWAFFKKHMTTTMYLNNCNESYQQFIMWYEKAGYADNARILKLTNGKYGGSSKTTTSIGYGTHYFWYKYR
jgi:hypothetical protein